MIKTIPSVIRISGISNANANAAIEPPRKREPVSPIKHFAGLKLKKRNPTRPPSMAEANNPS